MRKRRVDLRNAVKAGEQNALKMLVKLFDWLDGLEPQGSVEIVKRSQKCEVKSTGPLDQAVAKKAKNPAVSFLTWHSILIFLILVGNRV